MSDQPKDPGYCTPCYCSPSKHDRTPPVASSQQGRKVTADEAREAVDWLEYELHLASDCGNVQQAHDVKAHIDQTADRIRELEALLADVYREATDGDTGHTVARHIELGAPGIAFPTLNRETNHE